MKPGIRYWFILALLIAAAVALQALSHREPSLPQHPMSSIPLQFDNWSGRNILLEDRFVEALGVDDFVFRSYERPGEPPVGLYIGFYRTQRTGSTIHSPKNCLPGAGWQPVQNGTLELRLPDGSKALTNLYIVQRGMQKQVVLYWYQSHGRIIASEYWGKFYLVADAIRLNRTDAAIVRVTTPFEGSDEQARARAVSFAQSIIGQVNSAIPR